MDGILATGPGGSLLELDQQLPIQVRWHYCWVKMARQLISTSTPEPHVIGIAYNRRPVNFQNSLLG